MFASQEALRANAEIADREITGRLGIIGIPQHEWYWPAREHTFFAGRWPVKELGLTSMDYAKVSCPEAEAIGITTVVALVHGSARVTESSIVASQIDRDITAVPYSFSLDLGSAEIDPVRELAAEFC